MPGPIPIPTPSQLEESKTLDLPTLYNDTVSTFAWQGLGATLPTTGGDRILLKDVSGGARAGEITAIMGPSGCGKTLLLNRLAHRALPSKAVLRGDISMNGKKVAASDMRSVSSYVEQADSLIGTITARETLAFASKLGLSRKDDLVGIDSRVDAILDAFGLRREADVIVGTPVQRGLSGGQKRRLSVASQVICAPKVLFLDEPTSGLDSVASFEIISHLRAVARANKIIIIASIHQPSTRTFDLFDRVYLLAEGRLCYGGSRDDIANHFGSLGLDMPLHVNPAEWILEMVDTDFAVDATVGKERLARLHAAWAANATSLEATQTDIVAYTNPGPPTLRQPLYLLHRSFIKSYRDLTAYWLRVGMYTGLAILMGTTWLRLGYTQADITPRITNLFYAGAFLSFMAVAYIPAYIEDQQTFFKERANGWYGPTAFIIANTLIGLPFLFIIVMFFSVIAYWLCGLWPTAQGFWTFAGFLFLDLVAAESLVVCVASIVPNFIVSLAGVAFANGLWMCTNGFLVPETILNVFWKSWVSKIDYQNWAFRAMMWNEFHDQQFECAATSCAFPSDDGKTIAGRSVLAFYGYNEGQLGAYAAYMIAIAVVYRLIAWVALRLRK